MSRSTGRSNVARRCRRRSAGGPWPGYLQGLGGGPRGRIRAESSGAGLGGRVSFTIPVAEEAGDNSPGSVATRRRGEPGHPRIPAVDDDPQAVEYVQRILLQAGYLPLVTGDPEEVAGLIQTGEPDRVPLDLVPPGTDGIKLIQRVPALGDQPVIFLSLYGRGETIARALEIGAADYVVKLFSPTELVARTRAALRRYSGPPG